MRPFVWKWCAVAAVGLLVGCDDLDGVGTNPPDVTLRLDLSADAANPANPLEASAIVVIGDRPVVIGESCVSAGAFVYVVDAEGNEVFFGQPWLIDCPVIRREVRSEILEQQARFTGHLFTELSSPGQSDYVAASGEYWIVATFRYENPDTGEALALESRRAFVWSTS